MKIGCIGHIQNDGYVFAKCFRALGHDARYFHLPSGSVLSQPFWEDGEYLVPYEQLQDPRLVRELRPTWSKPDWVVEHEWPIWLSHLVRLAQAAGQLFPRELKHPGSVIELAKNHVPFYRDELRTCDWVLASSVPGVLACQAAGVPFVFWPHGQDARDAMGQRELIRHNATITRLRTAVGCALVAGSHGSDMNRLLRQLCGPEKVATIPFLLNTAIYRPEPAQHALPFLPERVNEILERRERLVFFMPSRFSDYWKGTGLFLEAYFDLVKRHPRRFFLIASGWGQDFPKYRTLISNNPVARETIYCLPGSLSKPYLRRLVNSVDVVVDQFVVGWYGTAFIEAAGMGKMVLTHLDRDQWDDYIDLPFPPVRDVKTGEQIRSVLEGFAAGSLDPDADGRQMHAWALESHGLETWGPRLLGLVEAALAGYTPTPGGAAAR